MGGACCTVEKVTTVGEITSSIETRPDAPSKVLGTNPDGTMILISFNGSSRKIFKSEEI